MGPEMLVERVEGFLLVGFLQRLDFIEQVGVRADGALAEDDQVAGDDIGTLDGDPDRDRAVGGQEIVERAVDHRLAGMHVHRIGDGVAHAGGGVVFHDRRDDGELVALVERRRGQAAAGVDGVGAGGDAGHRLLHPAEKADGQVELLADAGIGAGGVGGHGGGGGGKGGQGDAAAGGQRAHQHHPATAGIFRPADDVVEGYEDILAGGWAIEEHGARGQVAATGFDAGQVGGHEGAGDADILGLAQQVIGVAQLEGEAQHGADRRQGNVALGPVHPDAQHFLAVPLAFADDAIVGHRRGVGTRVLAGQAEGGQLLPAGEAGQPVLLLVVGAELQDQLARAQRVGHHDGDGGHDGMAGDVADHLGMGVGGEAEPAVLLRDDHAEEALFAQEVPGFGRQVGGVVVDFPAIHHPAEFAAGAVDEGLFLVGQGRRLHRSQHRPVGLAREQLGLEMHVAGIDGLGLGIRQGGQGALGPFEYRLGDVVSAK